MVSGGGHRVTDVADGVVQGCRGPGHSTIEPRTSSPTPRASGHTHSYRPPKIIAAWMRQWPAFDLAIPHQLPRSRLSVRACIGDIVFRGAFQQWNRQTAKHSPMGALSWNWRFDRPIFWRIFIHRFQQRVRYMNDDRPGPSAHSGDRRPGDFSHSFIRKAVSAWRTRFNRSSRAKPGAASEAACLKRSISSVKRSSKVDTCLTRRRFRVRCADCLALIILCISNSFESRAKIATGRFEVI